MLNFLAQVITTQLSKSLLGRNDNMSNNVNDSISADNDSISRCSNNAGKENQINYSALMAMHTVIVVFAPVAVVGIKCSSFGGNLEKVLSENYVSYSFDRFGVDRFVYRYCQRLDLCS